MNKYCLKNTFSLLCIVGCYYSIFGTLLRTSSFPGVNSIDRRFSPAVLVRYQPHCLPQQNYNIKFETLYNFILLLHVIIAQTLMNTLHGLLNCQIDGLNYRFMIHSSAPLGTQLSSIGYTGQLHWVHMYNLFSRIFQRQFRLIDW